MPAWPLIFLLFAQAPSSQPPPAPSLVPAAQPPAEPPAVTGDPATVTFETGIGLLLVLVKPDRTGDYEAALMALQGALATATDDSRRAMARGWVIFKATEPDAKGNAVYVHALLPAVPGADYRPSMLLDDLLTDVPDGLIERYTDALAAPPARLSLTEVANMSVVPVKK